MPNHSPAGYLRETPKHAAAKTPKRILKAIWYLPLIIKEIKPPPIAATAIKPIIGPIAEMVKPKPLFAEAIALDICKSKNEPNMIPIIATPKAIIKGILILFMLINLTCTYILKYSIQLIKISFLH